MANFEDNITKVISTLKILLYKNEEFHLFDILNNCKPKLNYSYSDFNIDYYTLLLEIDIDYFTRYYGNNILRKAEEYILGYVSDILRGDDCRVINSVVISPAIKDYINWQDIAELYDKNSLIHDIERITNILIEVATGANIEQLNSSYISIYKKIDEALKKINIKNPNPYKNLWDAHQYWSANLKTYADRRVYFANIYQELIETLKENDSYSSPSLHLSYTGWQELDRKIAEIKKQFKEAVNEEQFNGIGAMCRSAFVTLANMVYKEDVHKTLDGVTPSKTDYKRKLEAFINYHLNGSTNEIFRNHCKKTTALADELTHKLTANKTQTALTITALISVVNIIKILNGNSYSL